MCSSTNTDVMLRHWNASYRDTTYVLFLHSQSELNRNVTDAIGKVSSFSYLSRISTGTSILLQIP